MLDGIDVANEKCLSDAIKANPKNLGEVYASSFSYADQEAFLRCVCGAKCKIIISNYDLILYNKYLTPDRGWRKITYDTTTSVGGRSGKRTEVLWLNY